MQKQYTCPMHPEILQAQPGSCPLCGMALEPRFYSPEEEDRKELKAMALRFWISVFLSLPIIFLSMGFFSGAPWIQAALATIIVIWGGLPLFERGWNSIIHRHLNMFTLISLGVAATYLYSMVALFGKNSVYFDSASVITVLVLLGQVLELRTREQASQAIRSLLDLSPKMARILLEDHSEKEIPLEEVKQGDFLRIRPGEKIPTDGIVVEGTSFIDESMITGEPFPIKKESGDKVTGGTLNGTGSFTMHAEKVGADTLLSRMIRLVTEAQRSRAPIQKLADLVSSYFVPSVVLIAILTFIFWAFLGPRPAFANALMNAAAVLIIACPCALGLATPISIIVGVGRGAREGILIKNGEALELMSKVDTVVIDKTGTLTEGKPQLAAIFTIDKSKEEDLLQLAASIEVASEHPIASTLIARAKEKSIPLLPVEDFKAIPGKGILGKTGGKIVAIGNQKLLADLNIDSSMMQNKMKSWLEEGKTVLYLVVDQQLAALFAISDAIKSSTQEAIAMLHEEGIRIVMLTGDHRQTAKAVGQTLKIDEIVADVLPEEKHALIKQLQAEGRIVAMAGDGINDAPALAQASIGIAMGTGSDIAIESSGITLVKGDLRGIAKARNLSHATMRNIRQNLWFAFLYNALGVPIAAGILYPFFGWLLSPMIASAAMTLSSVSVILNALRLRHQKI